MGVLAVLVLLIASALILVGSALLWQANRDQNTFPSQLTSAIQYESIVFIFAALTGWLHHFSTEHDSNGRVVWRYFFYGLLYFAAVLSWNDWQNVDYNRHFYNTGNGGIYYNQADNQKIFGGQILAYAGLLVLLWSVNGGFKPRGFMTVLFFLIAIALNVVGSVILWKLDLTQITGSGSQDPQDNNFASGTARDTVFQVAVSQWITLIILGGGVLHEHVDGAHAAVLFIATQGIWALSEGFDLKYAYNTDADEPSSQTSKAWAGALFCWFSAWVALVTARWTAATFQDKTIA